MIRHFSNIALLVLLFIIGCGKKNPTDLEYTGSLNIRVIAVSGETLPKTSAVGETDSLRCRIDQGDEIVLDDFIPRTQDGFNAEYRLKAGRGYRIWLYALSDNEITYRGSHDRFEILAGETKNLEIELTSFRVQLLQPDQDTLSNSAIEFSWKNIRGAVRYELQVSGRQDFASLVLHKTDVRTTRYQSKQEWTAGAYFWRIRAADDHENWGAWSEVRTLQLRADAPPAPVLLSPVQGELTGDNRPVFHWRKVDSAVEYGLEIALDESFANLVAHHNGIADTTFSATAALPDGRYTWRVRARNSSNVWSTWSSLADFSVKATPQLVYPTDGEMLNDVSPTLRWQFAFPASISQLQVSPDSTFVIPEIDVTVSQEAEYTAMQMQDGKYCWRVRARIDSARWGPWSAIWLFEILTAGPPAPALVSPQNGKLTNDDTPTYIWENSSTRTVTYDLQVSTGAAFDSLEVEANDLTRTTFTNSRYLGRDEGWVHIPLHPGHYLWRVRGRDQLGNIGGWTDPWNFTVVKKLVPTPQLLQPQDNAVTSNKRPRLEWEPVVFDGEISYQLQLSTSFGFDAPIIDQTNLLPATFEPADPLQEMDYFWRVRAFDDQSNRSNWSDIRRFTVATVNLPPPSLVSPPLNAHLNVATPSLNWTTVPEAHYYHLQVSTAVDFEESIIDETALQSTSYTTSDTLVDGEYYWRVRSGDRWLNWGDWSAAWRFEITTSGPPAPDLVSPPSGTAINVKRPQFKWRDVTRAAGYGIHIATDSLFQTLTSDHPNLTATTFVPPHDLQDARYFWRVRAKDILDNWGEWSSVWTITVKTRGPQAPLLIAPEDGLTLSNNQPSFVWHRTADASRYALQLSSNSDFSDLLVNEQSLGDTSHTTLQTLADGTYFWRVQARDTLDNAGDWSAIWQLAIKTSGPPPPALIAPANGATTDDSTPRFEWHEVAQAQSYEIHLATENTFQTLLFSQEIHDSTTFSIPDTLQDGLYYWRMRAKDQLHNWGTWSSIWSFRVKARAPEPPILVLPARGSTIASAQPLFTWLHTPNAAGYELQVSSLTDFDELSFASVTDGDTSIVAPVLLDEGSYFWRVRASNHQQNWGRWSNVWSFSIRFSTVGPRGDIKSNLEP